ncbi:ribonuclease R [Selenomonas sp. WCA-380-WT-3B 3/]|uniref:Ribonuclease R n=1 Tax=Selenomonas montiformis TaxID=2652285 RepID=A0A6I2UVQ5_9FIRM|nr:ribonuclease R [Selenomonas montiformis]MSV24435.1 ribonuclease R [Selenomonas montiformis]
MDLKERIVAYMREDAYKPLLAEDLAEGMGLTQEELVHFDAALEELEKEGVVIRNRSDLYGLPSRMHLVVGRLSMSAKGFGFIIPDVRASEDETDVFVPGPGIGSAMHGDRVVARVTPSEEPGRSREGEILRILERANEKIVGTFERSKTFGFVTPDNTKLTQDVFVPKKAFHGAKTGSKVVVKITKWPERRRNAEGEVVEVLGKAGDPGVDVLSVMRQYDLSETFPEEVQAAAEAVEQEPSPEEYRGRADRRSLPIVTVDGEDSKDLDDGVYARRNEDGSFFLGVYIADVSWYVRENQPLDREARERGTSVYLVDRVIPMLPKELSNGICSLNAGVDRLSMACEMQISPEGEVTSYEILPAVIHVYRRLTYHIVNKVLVDREEPFLSDNQDIRTMLETLADLRGVLKEKRHRRGSIDFELPEVKVKLDAEGHPVALIKREGSLAESIIEECMLAANETVARHMDEKHLPFMYRVHEQPSAEKIERFNNLLAAFGLFVRPDEAGQIRPMDVQRVLSKVEGRPEERIISTVALRSMQQARYSELSLGHFGLAARYYTHFTSPIRRYPDLIVHRLLRETFATGTMPAERQVKLRSVLPEIAEHASQRERVAIEAERETTDMKKIEYMAQFVGETFDGIISGVTAFGLFVELDNGVEGLVHVSTMVNDYYDYVEEQYAMVGERTQKKYRLGDEVQILLVRANVEERNLDFVLKDNGAYDPAAMKNAVRGGRKESSAGHKEERGKKRGESRPARGESSRKPKIRDIIAEPVEDAGTPKKKKHRGGRNRKRGASGEKLSHPEPEKKGKRGKAAGKDRRPAGKDERRGGAEGHSGRPGADYHRVRVTGLNSAVWPDPPGYHERKMREEAQAGQAGGAPKHRPRPHHRTERSTGNSK